MIEIIKKKLEARPFLFFLLASLGFHIVLIIFFFSSNNLWSIFRKSSLNIEPMSIQVDMVALPDLPVKRQQKKKEKAVLIPKESKKQKPKKSEKKKNELKSKDRPKPSSDKKITSPANKKIASPANKKDKINKGNQLVEGAKKGKNILSSQEMNEINIYFSAVEEKIKSFWNLPKYLTDIDLTAQIEMKISPNGMLKTRKIEISSGNDLFDSLVLKSIENAAPYPVPPASVQNLIKNGIILSLSSRN